MGTKKSKKMMIKPRLTMLTTKESRKTTRKIKLKRIRSQTMIRMISKRRRSLKVLKLVKSHQVSIRPIRES